MTNAKTYALKEFLTMINRTLTATIEESFGECDALMLICAVGGQVQIASSISKNDMHGLMSTLVEQIERNEQVEEEHIKPNTRQ